MLFKLLKRLAKFILFLMLFMLIAFFLFYQYLISDWNQAYDVQRFEQLKEEIRNAPEMPELYYIAIDKVHCSTTTKNHILNGFKGNRKSSCPCLEVMARTFLIRERKDIRNIPHVLSIKLEKEFTQKQCLNHMAQNFYFRGNRNGLKKAAKYFFDKELNLLTEYEFAILTLMFKNSTLYNPIRFPERVERELKQLGYESDLSKILRPPKSDEVKSN